MKALAALLTAVFLTIPGAAMGDGYPLPVQDVGPDGIADEAGDFRYVTRDDGRDTLLMRIEQDGGEVAGSYRLDGLYTIPVVGLDGSVAGLSADGGTLVLISPRPGFPRETTELQVFDTEDIRHPRSIELDGDFSFDALSPDGRTMYLINYASRRDPTEYDVRAFDLASQRLVGGPIVDPDEAGDEMYGWALSRVTSADGRWAYTLYYGREHPFVHALDTVEGEAACIDLDEVTARDMYVLGLESDAGPTLTVTKRDEPVATIDAETHEVGASVAPDPVAEPDQGTSSPTVASLAIATGVALLLVAVAMAWRRRGRPLA